MVSYFIPRGRFLIKTTASLRQPLHLKQYQLEKWPMFRQFRQTFSSSAHGTSSASAHKAMQPVDCWLRRKAHTQSDQGNDVQKQTGIAKAQHYRGNSWYKWTSFLLRWTPVSILFYGVIEWQMHKRKCDHEQQPRIASSLQAKIYCCLPLRILSRCWGWLAACQVPITMRPYIYGWYSNAFNVNLDEALYPNYEHYRSLAEFFTRPLRNGVRVIDPSAPLVSPADGKVLHYGTASDSLIEQVKGVNYNIESFLGPPTWVERMKSTTTATKPYENYADMIKETKDNSTTLYQCVIYLAPGDYHRFHSPAAWQPFLRRHFDGELLSVSPRIATWMPELFCLNERVVYVGHWQHGFFSYTAVGATNVGSVQIYMDNNLKTNQWVGFHVGTHKKRQSFDEVSLVQLNSGNFQKGDLVGQFNMGSTIVLLFEAPKNFKFNIVSGQHIRVGEPLGQITNSAVIQ